MKMLGVCQRGGPEGKDWRMGRGREEVPGQGEGHLERVLEECDFEDMPGLACFTSKVAGTAERLLNGFSCDREEKPQHGSAPEGLLLTCGVSAERLPRESGWGLRSEVESKGTLLQTRL